MASNFMSSTPLPRRELKRQRVGSNSCPKCEATISDKSLAVTCGICELDFCLDCSKVPKQMALALSEDTLQNFMWTCNSCKQNFPSLTGISAQLKSIEDTTYKRLSKLEDDVHDMKTGLDEKIRGEVKTIKPSLIEEIKQDIKSTLQDDVRMVVREIEDQKTRAMNLIFFNVPESEDKNNIVRNEYDHSLINEVCTLIKIQEPDIKIAFRLGKQIMKPRPLKIVFNNKKHRKDILDNAYNMKNIPVSNKLSKVIIAKDLTIQQRDQNKKKRELKNKNNKQSLQKTKASEMKTIQEEVDDMEIQNCQDTDQDYYTQGTILHAPTNDSHQSLAPLSCNKPLERSKMHLSFSNVGDETLIGGFNIDQRESVVGQSDQHTEHI